MCPTFFIFVVLLLIIIIPNADAETVRAYLLSDGEVGGDENGEIISKDNEPVNLSANVKTVSKTTKTIGSVKVDLVQEVKFIAVNKNTVVLKNTALQSVSVEIPNNSKVSGPASWDKKITPSKQVTTSGTVPSGFKTPTSSILIGSTDVVLIFDKAVTITLTGITGQTAYKLPGQTSWTLISTCLGTYDNPTEPQEPNECSITNGIDTKILTFHFTEFAGLSSAPSTSAPSTSAPSVSSSNSGGGGGRSSGSSSTSTGFAGKILPEGTVSEASVFPKWFQASLVTYWVDGLVTDYEFKNAMHYMLNKNIIKIDIAEEKDVQLLDLAPSIKQLFKLWSLDKLSDSAIINIVKYYRTVGVW